MLIIKTVIKIKDIDRRHCIIFIFINMFFIFPNLSVSHCHIPNNTQIINFFKYYLYCVIFLVLFCTIYQLFALLFLKKNQIRQNCFFDLSFTHPSLLASQNVIACVMLHLFFLHIMFYHTLHLGPLSSIICKFYLVNRCMSSLMQVST